MVQNRLSLKAQNLVCKNILLMINIPRLIECLLICKMIAKCHFCMKFVDHY